MLNKTPYLLMLWLFLDGDDHNTFIGIFDNDADLIGAAEKTWEKHFGCELPKLDSCENDCYTWKQKYNMLYTTKPVLNEIQNG